MKTAAIVYWYSGSDLRSDGGGLRVIAWERALKQLGFDPKIVPLRTIGGGVKRGGRISRVKRTLVPMPFQRDLPDAAIGADLVVATVPAVFASAMDSVPHERLVLDWMDMWSQNARNVGDASLLSRPGGIAQSAIWKRREARWQRQGPANVYAGFSDFAASASRGRTSQYSWLPTPVGLPLVRRSGEIRVRRLGFIGNFDYAPNQLSLRDFLRDYGGALQTIGIDLVVAGYGSEALGSWDYPIDILGELDSPVEFYSKIDAAVVPIRHGGGIKVKAIEAFSFGIPVFGTEHVREGFSPQFRPWVLEIDQLLTNPELSVSPVPAMTYDACFSQNAFTSQVSTLVDRL